jgi:hypothetical protein
MITVRSTVVVSEKESSKAVPPYVSYKTFDNFLNGLKAGVPSHVDKSVIRNLSGGVQSQLLNALRYLGLIDERNRTQESLTRLASSEGPEREHILAEILQSSYPFLFDDTFDLGSATAMQYYDRFRDAGANGETIRKCAVFVVAAAKDAGLKVSPYIDRSASTRTDQPKPIRPRTQQSAQKNGRGRSVRVSPTPSPASISAVEATSLSWEQMLLSKFPSFDPTWPDDVKAKWFDAFDRLMASGQGREATQRVEYPTNGTDEDSGNEE